MQRDSGWGETQVFCPPSSGHVDLSFECAVPKQPQEEPRKEYVQSPTSYPAASVGSVPIHILALFPHTYPVRARAAVIATRSRQGKRQQAQSQGQGSFLEVEYGEEESPTHPMVRTAVGRRGKTFYCELSMFFIMPEIFKRWT